MAPIALLAAPASFADPAYYCHSHIPKDRTVTQPLIVVATIVAKAASAPFVRAALERVVPPSRAEAGCARYDLHVDNATPGRFVMLEEWSGDAALAAHETTPHFAALVREIAGLAEVRIDKLTKIA
jgi:quinol monooxygenase YgiN